MNNNAINKKRNKKLKTTKNNTEVNKYKQEAIETLIDKKALYQTIRSLINRDKLIEYHIKNNKLQNNTPVNIRMDVINKWIKKYGLLNFLTKGEFKELYYQQDSVNRFLFHEELNQKRRSEYDTKTSLFLNSLRGEYLYDSKMLYGSQLYQSLNNYSDKGDFFINPIIPLLPSMTLLSTQTHSSLSKMIVLNPLLIVCYDNGLINVYKNNQLLYSYNLHNSEIKDCEISECRQYICASDKNGLVSLVKIGCNVETETHYCRYYEYYTENKNYKNFNLQNNSIKRKGYKNIKIPYILFRTTTLIEAVIWSGCILILVDVNGVIRKYAIEEICKFKELQISEEENILTAPITLHPISRFDITRKLHKYPQVSVISISNCHRYIFIGGNWAGILIYDILETYTTNLEEDILKFKPNTVSLNNKNYTLIEPLFEDIKKDQIEDNEYKYMFISCDRVVDMMYHPYKDCLIVATTGEVFELSYQEISGSKKLTNLNIKPFVIRNLKLNPDNLHSAINKSIKITEKSITMEVKEKDLPQNILRNKSFNGSWERRDLIGYNFHENFIQFTNYEIPEDLPFILRTLICHDHILLLLTNNKLMVEHKWCQCLNIKKDFNRGMYVPIDVGTSCLIEVHPKKRLIIIADYDIKFYDLYGNQIFNLDFNCIYKFDKSLSKKSKDNLLSKKYKNNLKNLEDKNFIYKKGKEYKITEIMFNETGDELYVANEMGYINIYSLNFSEKNNLIQKTVKRRKKEKITEITEIYETKKIKASNAEFRSLNFLNKKGSIFLDQNYTFFTPQNVRLNSQEYICGYTEIGNLYESYLKEFNENVDYEISPPLKENDKPSKFFKNFGLSNFDNFILKTTKNCEECRFNLFKEEPEISILLKVEGDFYENFLKNTYDFTVTNKVHLINKHYREAYKVLSYLKYKEVDLLKVHNYWFCYYEAMDHPTVPEIILEEEESITETSDTLIRIQSDWESSSGNKDEREEVSSFSEEEDSIDDFIDDDVTSD